MGGIGSGMKAKWGESKSQGREQRKGAGEGGR